jgi:hypothetical protein
MQPESLTGLYWSIRGEVACGVHGPDADDPRWTAEGWQPLPPSSQGARGINYQCQHCAVSNDPFFSPSRETH